jgi:hypothetical protein
LIGNTTCPGPEELGWLSVLQRRTMLSVTLGAALSVLAAMVAQAILGADGPSAYSASGIATAAAVIGYIAIVQQGRLSVSNAAVIVCVCVVFWPGALAPLLFKRFLLPGFSSPEGGFRGHQVEDDDQRTKSGPA